jgi:hypothetical protein
MELFGNFTWWSLLRYLIEISLITAVIILGLKLTATNGGWSNWTQVPGTCTGECNGGTGTALVLRECNNPSPSIYGTNCKGTTQELIPCENPNHCPIKGGWTSWSTCEKTNVRKCTNPSPQFGGEYCSGSATEIVGTGKCS